VQITLLVNSVLYQLSPFFRSIYDVSDLFHIVLRIKFLPFIFHEYVSRMLQNNERFSLAEVMVLNLFN
jgi:hypothetical protein